MKSFRYLLFMDSIIFTSNALAWNYTRHVLIAQIAYNNLNPQIKVKANQLSNLIYQQLPVAMQAKLDFQYPNAVTFAKIAMLPDVWRNWRVSSIYAKFGGYLPLNLLMYSSSHIATWHFVDKPYPADKSCFLNNSSNVIWALNKLIKNLSISYNQNTKAVTMVLTEHLVGDIHQPLHAMTNVSTSCLGDRGGNDVCLKQNARDKCSKNLHSLWDSGVGYLKLHVNIQSLAYELQHVYPQNSFTKTSLSSISLISFVCWSEESYSYSTFVYTLTSL